MDADKARSMLDYEESTGVLLWRYREDRTKRWNSLHAGRPAGSLNDRGYVVLNIDGRIYRAHRLIWLIVYGHWPADQVDHIDGRRDNNRLANLREVNNQENHRNMRKRADNTSGLTGVYFNKRSGKWDVRLRHDGRGLWLGSFNSLEEAGAVRVMRQTELGYTKDHGA